MKTVEKVITFFLGYIVWAAWGHKLKQGVGLGAHERNRRNKRQKRHQKREPQSQTVSGLSALTRTRTPSRK